MRWLYNEVKKLKDDGEKVVIITHHAPSQNSVPDCYKDDILSAAYASHLDEFVEKSCAKVWIHGHIHTQQDYTVGSTRVICNPRGYPDEKNENFIPDYVIEI